MQLRQIVTYLETDNLDACKQEKKRYDDKILKYQLSSQVNKTRPYDLTHVLRVCFLKPEVKSKGLVLFTWLLC